MSNRVLYIEDDEQWRNRVAESLGAAGCDVVTAADPGEAMRLAEQGKYSVFLLDTTLAGEDSLILMRFLKHNHPDVRVVLYSDTQHDDATVVKILSQGADSYLVKGSMEELLVGIGQYLLA